MNKWVLSLGFILLSISFFLSSCGGKKVGGVDMSKYERELISEVERSRGTRIMDIWDYKELPSDSKYDFKCSAKEELRLGMGTCVFTIFFSIDKYGRVYKFATNNGERTYKKEVQDRLDKVEW